MSRIIQLDSTFTDNTLPVMKWLGDYETKIRALGNVAGWWDASSSAYRSIATGVSQLTDRSGNGKHLIQATGANQPPVSANTIGTLIQRDGIVFDGVTSRSLVCSSFFDGSGVWSYATYTRAIGPPGNYNSPISGEVQSFYYNGPVNAVGINNVPTLTFDASIYGLPRLLIDVATASDQYLEVAPKSATSAAAVLAPANNSAIQIGDMFGNASYKANMTWFEAIVFKGDLRTMGSGTAIALLKEYFAYKYER